MTRFIEWLNSPPATVWPPIARAIAAHFYFISIHPFSDGNGRTARAIESYLLYQTRVNALGFYSLANFYYRNRATYIEKLDEVRFGPGQNLTPFVLFAVRGLLEELQTAFDEVHAETTLVAFRDYARSQLEQTGKLGTPAGARMQQFLSLLGRERVSVAALKRWGDPLARPFVKVSEKTLSRDLQFLEDNQLIGREGGYVWARLDIMEQFT